jgi:serine protease AprX
MAARIGPLLRRAMAAMGRDGAASDRRALAAHIGAPVAEAGRLPVVMKLPTVRPRSGERYPEYRERVLKALDGLPERLGGEAMQPLVAGNALAGAIRPEEAATLAAADGVRFLELDPQVRVVRMDDAIVDAGVEPFRNRHGALRGEGVRVAVLDTGVDTRHPFLAVAESASTVEEPVEIPGRHGTHCAGSVASRDELFPGIAPGVDLLNVKVLRGDGTGSHTSVARGVDAALELEADVLSLSLGFNHLPAWSDRGHGWSCARGDCPLCTAVDNAFDLGALPVVAAGNEHQRADALRQIGFGASFDTELGCPGQARHAVTVGALTKRTFLPAAFSSRGPTAYGLAKPDLVAPGVNVTSTVPVPRDAAGRPVRDPPRAVLFDRESGTSMATPIVAGAVALLIQHRRERGLKAAPADIRRELLTHAVTPMSLPANLAGAGRLDLGRYGAILAAPS